MTATELLEELIGEARRGSGELRVVRRGARIVLETEGANPAVIGCPSGADARRQVDELLYRANELGAEVVRVN